MTKEQFDKLRGSELLIIPKKGQNFYEKELRIFSIRKPEGKILIYESDYYKYDKSAWSFCDTPYFHYFKGKKEFDYGDLEIVTSCSYMDKVTFDIKNGFKLV